MFRSRSDQQRSDAPYSPSTFATNSTHLRPSGKSADHPSLNQVSVQLCSSSADDGDIRPIPWHRRPAGESTNRRRRRLLQPFLSRPAFAAVARYIGSGRRWFECAGQTRLPQFGQAASCDGAENSRFVDAPQRAHSLGNPSGVREETVTSWSGRFRNRQKQLSHFD